MKSCRSAAVIYKLGFQGLVNLSKCNRSFLNGVSPSTYLGGVYLNGVSPSTIIFFFRFVNSVVAKKIQDACICACSS